MKIKKVSKFIVPVMGLFYGLVSHAYGVNCACRFQNLATGESSTMKVGCDSQISNVTDANCTGGVAFHTTGTEKLTVKCTNAAFMYERRSEMIKSSHWQLDDTFFGTMGNYTACKAISVGLTNN